MHVAQQNPRTRSQTLDDVCQPLLDLGVGQKAYMCPTLVGAVYVVGLKVNFLRRASGRASLPFAGAWASQLEP